MNPRNFFVEDLYLNPFRMTKTAVGENDSAPGYSEQILPSFGYGRAVALWRFGPGWNSVCDPSLNMLLLHSDGGKNVER